MVNCLDNNIRDIQTFGLRTIVATATQHFAILHEELGYNVSYHSDLRPILLNFLEHSLPMMGLEIPFKNKSVIVYDEDKLLELWEELFSSLGKIDSEEDICKWIILVENTKKKFGSRILTNKWRQLLLDFATEKISEPNISLPTEKIKDIKINVMKHRIERLDFRFDDVMDIQNYDDWEKYLVIDRKVEPWLINRIRLYKDLKLWEKLLVDLLTIEEVENLDSWGHTNISRQYNSEDYFSLSELRNDLLRHDFSLSKS